MFEFKNFDCLTDDEIDLKIVDKTPPDEEKGYVPAYCICQLKSGPKIQFKNGPLFFRV